jgi:hypothetical protein
MPLQLEHMKNKDTKACALSKALPFMGKSSCTLSHSLEGLYTALPLGENIALASLAGKIKIPWHAPAPFHCHSTSYGLAVQGETKTGHIV